MAPNLDSVSEDSQSGDQTSQLDYIEQTLRRIQNSTLKMKRRNDEVIKSMDRRKTLTKENACPSTSSSGAVKPPRTTASKLTQDVKKVLEETSEIKKRMQSTLRECEQTREKNAKYLDQLRHENRVLSSTTPNAYSSTTNSSLRSNNSSVAQPSLFGFGGIKEMFRKLSTSSLEVDSKDFKVPLPPPPLAKVEPPSNTTISHPKSSISQAPIPKPRRKSIAQPTTLPVPTNQVDSFVSVKPNSPKHFRRPQEAPPSPPCKTTVTYEELKRLYQNAPATDDESTLPRPVPKPRTKVATKPEEEMLPLLSNENDDDGDETSSEYEFHRPLRYQTVQISDSDDSFVASISSIESPEPLPSKTQGYLKKTNAFHKIPIHFKKPSKTDTAEDIKKVTKTPQISKPKKIKTRPSSPPPPPFQVVRTSSKQSILENLVEDEESTEKVIPETSTPRYSALISGFRIDEIHVLVTPFTDRKTKYRIIGRLKIPTTPSDPTAELEPIQENELKIINTEDKIEEICKLEAEIIQQSIVEEFAFLDSDPELETIPEVVEKEVAFENDITITEKSCIYHTIEISTTELVTIEHDHAPESRMYPTLQSVEESVLLKDVEIEISTNEDVPPLPSSSPPTEEIAPKFTVLEPEHEINNVSVAHPPPPLPPKMPSEPIFSDSFKIRKPLPIIPLVGSNIQSTVFSTLMNSPENEIKLDTSFIEDNFPRGHSLENENRRLSIINLKTQNNQESPSEASALQFGAKWKKQIEIAGKQLKEKEKLLEAIKVFDTTIATTDCIEILKQILPKDNDEATLKNVKDDQFKTLTEQLQFMKSLSKIPRLREKLDTMSSILNFEETFQALRSIISTIQTATISIKQSTKFPEILKIVLSIINQVFVKDEDEPVTAFQLESLQRLATKKSSDGKLSLLHCIVRCIKKKLPESTMHFYNDFRNIENASKISKVEFQKVIQDVEEELKSSHDEITSSIKDSDDNSENVENLKRAEISVGKSRIYLEQIKTAWNSAVEDLEKVMQYFGMVVKQDENRMEFFTIIRNFVTDYKHALEENEKLFRQAEALQTKANSPIASSTSTRRSLTSEVVRRNKDSLQKPNRSHRLSLGNMKTLQDLKENPGQSADLVEALTNACGGVIQEGEKAQNKRRNPSFRTSRIPLKKTLSHVDLSDQRDRKM